MFPKKHIDKSQMCNILQAINNSMQMVSLRFKKHEIHQLADTVRYRAAGGYTPI
ncbi:hypothetical protein BN1221_03364 [Brenneria goodwinii]|uniref:Uncharacterized protein n=1 Tax=Brenneria goodwinii TaxID=1109412 RepID=A0A0G4JYS9_9GAMM|nr:hypothetical protein BN1221_03364 [Brenneria goodwinii]